MGLIEDSVAARKAGVSYGQYKMEHPFTSQQKKNPAQKYMHCLYCGNPLTGNQTKYCCVECSTKYWKEKRGEKGNGRKF